jgi:hypothetical protein
LNPRIQTFQPGMQNQHQIERATTSSENTNTVN